MGRHHTRSVGVFPLALGLVALAVLLPTAARGATFEQRLRAPEPQARAQLGWSVALDGATLAVGAPVTGGRGAVTVFERDGIDWTVLATLPAIPAAPGDQMGFAVALAGDRLVVGAPGAQGNRGEVHRFRRTAGGWQPDGVLRAVGGRAGDRFGEAVALDPNGDARVAVGAPGAETGSGVVYIFEGGTQSGRLTAVARSPDDAFGRAVALVGGTLVVGAPRADDGGEESGAVYLVERGASGWPTTASPERVGGAGHLLGLSVALSRDGRTVAVGSLAAGVVQLLDRPTRRWIALTVAPAEGENPVASQFGVSVSLGDDYLAVGARRSDRGGADSGTAFLFRRQGSGWSPSTPSRRLGSGSGGDEFGFAVSASGRDAAVGAYLADVAGELDAGAVHIFEQQNATVQFEADQSTVTEEDTVVAVPLRLETDDRLALRGEASVLAESRDDPVTVRERVLLPRGTTPGNTIAVGVAIFEDAVDEEDEILPLLLRDAQGATLGSPVRHELHVLDDDTAGITLRWDSQPGPLITSEGGTVERFTVALDSEPLGEVQVTLTPTDSTEGELSPPILRFTPADGLLERVVTVEGKADAETDGDVPYTIEVAVTSVDDAKYNDLPTLSIPVVNEDRPGAVSAVAVTLAVSTTRLREDLARFWAVTLRVGKSGDLPPAQTLFIHVVTRDGTARAGEDYEALDILVEIPAGTPLPLARTFKVPILDDCIFGEGTESFTVAVDPVGTTTENLGPPVELQVLDNERFFTDETAWRAFVDSVETFETTPGNVALAGEPLDDLGNRLSYPIAMTGLASGFTLRTLQNSTEFVLRNGAALAVKKKMGQGSAGGFAIDFEEGASGDLQGFALTLVSNVAIPAERLEVFAGVDDQKPVAGVAIPAGPEVFLGVVASCLRRIEIRELGPPDDSAFQALRFGISTPSVMEIPNLSPVGSAIFALLLLLCARVFLRGRSVS